VVRKLSWPKEHYGYKIGSESEVSEVWMNLKMTMQIWELKMVTVFKLDSEGLRAMGFASGGL